MLSNRMPMLATIVLGALALALTVVVATKIFALFEPVEIDIATTSIDAPARAPAASHVDMSALLNNPLFGRAEVAPAPVEATENVRETRLRIQLLGVVAGSDGDGVAVLSHDGKVRSYARGQALDMRKKVKLHSVYTDHVLIEHSGVRERLALKNAGGKNSAQDGVRRSTSQSTGRGPSRSAPVSTQSVNLQAPAIRSLVGDVRETVTTAPLKLVRFMTAQPWSDGQYQGYRIQPGIDKRLLPYLRLKPGDVVLAVNDKPIRSIDLGEVNSLVNNNDRFALRVLRDGQEIGINLDL